MNFTEYRQFVRHTCGTEETAPANGRLLSFIGVCRILVVVSSGVKRFMICSKRSSQLLVPEYLRSRAAAIFTVSGLIQVSGIHGMVRHQLIAVTSAAHLLPGGKLSILLLYWQFRFSFRPLWVARGLLSYFHIEFQER